LKAPINAGNVIFSDPRVAARVLVPPIKEFNIWTLPKIAYKPNEGMMLLFPSWLMYEMEVNLSDENRIYLSFNLGIS
jgi:Putative 2OG-Fe(II) oxygenase